MKPATLTHALTTASFLLAAGQPGMVSAHDQDGDLGPRKSARDIYLLTCPPGSQRLTFQVHDTVPVVATKVAITVKKDGASASFTDPVDGDNLPPLGTILARSLNKGAGVYTIEIFKKKPEKNKAENYLGSFHCLDSSNVHLEQDDPTQIQDQ
jgi:hypothetical protein